MMGMHKELKEQTRKGLQMAGADGDEQRTGRTEQKGFATIMCDRKERPAI